MVALMVALGVMAVMMTMAMPVWRQTAQREKEEEFLFRGRQYARAIGLFEKKYANTPPPTLDVLVQEKFLRKKFKDPITNADFVPIPAAPTPAAATGAGAQGAAPVVPTQVGATGGRGGVMGVTSASKERSLRVFNGATHYNEWRFVYAPPVATPGAGGGAGGAGQRGAQGGQPGQGGPGAGGARGGPGAGQGQGGPNRGNPNSGRPGAPGTPGNPGNPGGRNTTPGAPTAAPFGRGR